jgi:DNA mismatch endonuclease (patch repair protein)
MDTLTTAQRSERMARIRSKNTKPELIVRHLVHRLGYRYSLHSSMLPGKPDLVFTPRKKAVFVHGCFWHAHEACKVANLPKSRTAFWLEKFSRNRARDTSNVEKLSENGWAVCTVWECELKNEEKVQATLVRFLGPPKIKRKVKGQHHG